MQNFKNHRRIDWGWVIAFLIVVVFFCIAGCAISDVTIMQVTSISENPYNTQNMLQLLLGPIGLSFYLSIVLLIILLKLRTYATTLQDRIIRQEMQFRHYVMTGKTIDPRITINQMIALRFAGDSEFLDLCEKAASEGLAPKAIKAMITEWKGDEVRV